MYELKLISKSDHALEPIITAALENELHLVEAGIRQTGRCLHRFENQYHIQTKDFITSYENDELEETLDYIKWIGEFRMLERLHEKADNNYNSALIFTAIICI